MSLGRIVVSGLLLSLVPVLKIQACSGGGCLVSYFPGGDDSNHRRYFPKTAVATNAVVKSCNDYYLTLHLGTELAMIGAHYYPTWTGKAPSDNPLSTSKADELDFFTAGAFAAVPKKTVVEDWRRFTAFDESVCRRLENGEKVDIPPGVPDYALEFYLYKLGHAQWLVFRKDEDPAPFGKLLTLPKRRRLYRTVWVHFVRIANARRAADKDRHIDALRRAIDAGFEDTAALASHMLRVLSYTCGDRYAPLVLTAYAGVPWEKWPVFAKRIFCRRPNEILKEKWIENMCADPVGVEIAIAHGAGGKLPDHAVRPERPALGADRQAWSAFNRGDLELCRKLLAMAPERSLIRLFLEARLARLDGHYEKAGERLHAWLDEWRRRGQQAGGAVTGYGIRSVWPDGGYWYTEAKQDGEYGFYGSIYYSGAYGPSGCFHEWGSRTFRDYAVPQSREPTLSRIVSGELGVVKVATRDLEEALYAFLSARNWIDIAFVAERCMTVDELVKFMRGNRIKQRDRDLLRDLLMRRLMRCGRLREAATWAPQELKPLCDEFRALSAVAHDPKASADARALAFLNLSRLTATRGMEFMGTELRPDVAIYDGDYDGDGLPLEEPVDLPVRIGTRRTSSRWVGWKVPEDRVSERFHYRRRAIEYARSAVKYAKDKDVRAWALMFGGVASLSLDDVREADWFYRRLRDMRHPRARVDGWFNGPVYYWFKDRYYNQERHAVPLRVPSRFTKESLRKLSMQ